MDKLLFFAFGFLAARWLLMNKKDEYLQKESEFIDKVQNRLHDVLSQVTSMNDVEISDKVLEITEN
jgi:hypothetical protein